MRTCAGARQKHTSILPILPSGEKRGVVLMSYEAMDGGRIGGDGSGAGRMTFTDVEDRLVEAMLTCWRHADRERGWQRLRSAWPEISRDALAGDYDARGGLDGGDAPALKPASLTRREVAEMEEAFGWLDAIDPADRKIVALAVLQLAQGKREISWVAMLRRLGLSRGSDGLRKRYGRAISDVCAAINGGIAGG